MSYIDNIIGNIKSTVDGTFSKIGNLNWKQNIDYKSYDPTIEKYFVRDHDYGGLADYLSHFKNDDPEEQKHYLNEIANLRMLDRQYKALYSNASQDDKDALGFFEAFNHGDYEYLKDSSNSYNKRYLDKVKDLGKNILNIDYSYFPSEPSINAPVQEYDESYDPTTITVSFNNVRKSYGLWGLGPDSWSADEDKDFFADFCKYKGYSVSVIKDLLGESNYYNKDGIVTIKADKTNFNAIKLLSDINEWADNNGVREGDIWYSSINREGNVINDNTGVIAIEIREIRGLLTEADSRRENLIKTAGGGEQVYSTTTMPFVNELQQQLYEMASAGMITWDNYEHQLKADNDIYDAKLLGNDFGNLRIFKSTGGDMVEMTDNIERQQLKGLVSSAISEGRVRRMAAISGGQYGYYLEIDAVRDKADTVYDDNDARNTITLFFPGLFTSTVQTAFDNSTEGRTIKEMSSMQQYGYEYELPNGDIISRLTNDNATYKSKSNPNKLTIINREQAKKYIEESIVVEQGAYKIQDRMYNTDGSLRKGYDYSSDAMALAVQLVNEQDNESFTIGDVFNENGHIKVNEQNSSRTRDEHIEKAGRLYQMIMSKIFSTLNVNN